PAPAPQAGEPPAPSAPGAPGGGEAERLAGDAAGNGAGAGTRSGRRRRRGGRGRGRGGGSGTARAVAPVEALPYERPVDLDAAGRGRRRGRARKGRPVGRYLMCVHVDPGVATQIAVLEGRVLTEHYVSRPSDDVSQIHGNVYLGRVQNVLPGMEAA